LEQPLHWPGATRCKSLQNVGDFRGANAECNLVHATFVPGLGIFPPAPMHLRRLGAGVGPWLLDLSIRQMFK